MLTSQPSQGLGGRSTSPERRTFPRLAVDLPVRVVSGDQVTTGNTVDVSERGALLSLEGRFALLARSVSIEVELPQGGWLTLEGEVVRREQVGGGRTLVAIRLAGPEPQAAPPRPRRRRSRAKPKPPRPREVVEAELRGLGGLVYEQALLAPGAEPGESIITWVNALAHELGTSPVAMAQTNRELMTELVQLHRRVTASAG